MNIILMILGGGLILLIWWLRRDPKWSKIEDEVPFKGLPPVKKKSEEMTELDLFDKSDKPRTVPVVTEIYHNERTHRVVILPKEWFSTHHDKWMEDWFHLVKLGHAMVLSVRQFFPRSDGHLLNGEQSPIQPPIEEHILPLLLDPSLHKEAFSATMVGGAPTKTMLAMGETLRGQEEGNAPRQALFDLNPIPSDDLTKED